MKALPSLLALALFCLLLAACSQGGPAVPTVEPIAEPTATPSSAPTATLTAVPTPTTPSAPGAQTPERSLLVPTPTPRVERHTGPLTDAASATLEEFVLRSDVIARVSLLSVTAKAKTVPSGEGVAPTYQPMQELRFRALQGGYLKGSGGSELTVEVLDILGHTYLTESEALVAAQSWLRTGARRGTIARRWSSWSGTRARRPTTASRRRWRTGRTTPWTAWIRRGCRSIRPLRRRDNGPPRGGRGRGPPKSRRTRCS